MARGTQGSRRHAPFIFAACLLVALAEGRADDVRDEERRTALIASYSGVPDPFHWFSFYSLPRDVTDAQKDGWSKVNVTTPSPALAGSKAEVSTWCRSGDYKVCLVFDAAGIVAGLQVSVSVQDFEQSCGSRYPIALETMWRQQSIMGTDVYSATAWFLSLRALNEGGRVNFTEDDDTVQDTLFLENGNSFWEMPRNARDAANVAYTKQGCVKGMGHHFFYDMSPKMPCEDHRPFFLLFDDVTGNLDGFGVTLCGKASWKLLDRRWFEAPDRKLVSKMVPNAPQCFLDWAEQQGMVTLHVYFRPKPWEARCSSDSF